ncbi:ECF-type sigma factor [Nocardia brasiliensis]|uniref:ECF-type sigma factor n=1 Tax=Nocardia brasiliensis TaxID=37326 RepID=UPI0018951466|nr:ECF-type sigma factor [Nocardia brasiliensis]MBF6548842.1 sigma-70 family RNA polymerase sigma factor [Nocardia brasiliensis]
MMEAISVSVSMVSTLLESQIEIEIERQRRAGDVELFETLLADEFCGAGWDLVKREFARYAIGVLSAWVGSGCIVERLHGAVAQFSLSGAELKRLRTDPDFRGGVIDIAVAEALQQFKTRSLAGEGWRVEGGASLTTYFVGRCLIDMVNELNKHRRRDTRDRRCEVAAVEDEAAKPDEDRWQVEDPCRTALDRAVLRQYLNGLDQLDRALVWSKASNLTNNEIAEIFGVKARWVERRWSWLMDNVDWIGRLGGRETQ